MFYRHFRVQLLGRALLIAASALLLAYLIGWTDYYALWALAAGLFAYLVYGLIRYAEKTTRDLTRFLEAIRHADLSQRFVSGGRGPLFEELSEAYSEVVEAFKEVRAEKEEQVRYLENVVRHVGVALIAFRSETGKVELMNQAARRLLKTHKVRTLEALRPFSEELVQTMLRLESGGQELVSVTGDEERLELSIYATKFILRGRRYTLVSLQDIRRELEEKEMEAWQDLTRVLTHEIMNSVAPISSLAGTARGLLENGREEVGGAELEDVREAVETIGRRSEALSHFIDAYRSFTRLPTPQFELFEVKSLLCRVRRLLKRQMEEEGVACTVEVDPDDLTLTADEELVEQVLINLTLNAMEVLEGREDARLELTACPGERGIPVIRVRDNGSGISEEVQERIFLPFFTTKEEGSGIGLSLSRQIMRLHGGQISVRSEPGETVFTLRF